ncbi:hypothetical protein HCC30_28130 [Streptomyces sp. HNM0574]|nr:monovalent cation/H+ antiporter complex subunit F [Streptomyces sp. HNM0574]NLU71100.1 hypothetical protein [Streptomyces sp. HNM0574]
MLVASGVMVVIRLARGPSTLDRAVALDALVAVLMAGVGIHTATQRIPFYLPVLLVLSFLGFTGSVGVARFLALRDEAGSAAADDPEPASASDSGSAPGRRPGEGEAR